MEDNVWQVKERYRDSPRTMPSLLQVLGRLGGGSASGSHVLVYIIVSLR